MFGWLKNIVGVPVAKPQARPPLGSVAYANEILAQSFEAFRLARRDRQQGHNQPHGFSGDSAVIGSHDLMHRRTRDQIRNVAQAKKIQRSFENLVVGPRGMQTFAWPFLPSELFEITTELASIQAGELGPRLQYALESDDLFDEYFHEKHQFDIEGRLSGPEMYRMLMGECVVVGNGLMIRVFRKDYDPAKHLIPVAWQMFEREQLAQEFDRPASRGENAIVGGIEFNGQNQAVKYHLYIDHPHDFFGVSQSSLVGVGSSLSSVGNGRTVAVEAARVIDLAQYDRPSSSLGHSWLDAVGQSLWDRDSYMGSTIQKAAIEAAFILIAKLQNGEKYGGDWGFQDDQSSEDEYGNREFKLGRSPFAATIGTDESIEIVKAESPSGSGQPFIKGLDHDIAGGAGLSYYTITGDYESSNFSSTRAAKMDEDLDLAPMQQWFGVTVALPVRRLFNSLAAAGGRFTTISPSEYLKNIRTYNRFDVIANGRDLLDPRAEGDARTARLRTCMSTFKAECARTNQHWIRVLIQLAIEKQVIAMFGVTPDWSNGGGMNPTQPAGQQVDDATTDEDVLAKQPAGAKKK